ncbi:MAG TPA: FAD-binding oxidoreductase [Steroidobacteraceae bacterium]|jgi:FAD/FMN-containing dehydrogenase
MQRRKLLQGAAALPLVALAPWKVLGTPTRAVRRVRPADPGWPTPAQWQQLKDATGGGLLPVQPLFAACTAGAGSAGCRQALAGIRNPFYIGDQPGGTQVSGWLGAWTPAASAYALRARDSGDVAAAVNFARTHNLRLVVKGGGHSYQGTSSAPDSLLVWTRALNRVELHDAFVGQGCAGRIAPVAAVSTGAGAMWIDLYQAVTTQAGRYVQGGGCATVGVAGLIQSGGFGSFSKGFGSAAASLLEAEIVTADGTTRLANACTNADLFWALKGGGGGSWGVVTRLTLRTHPLPEFFGYAEGTIKAHSDAAFRRLVARFVAFYASALFNPHWGEQVAIGQDNTLRLSLVSQGLTEDESGKLWQPFCDWVRARPADYAQTQELISGVHAARGWWDAQNRRSMNLDTRAGAPAGHGWWKGDQDQVGMYLHGYESLWLPASLLQANAQSRLSDALVAASRHKEVGLHFNKGLAGAPPAAVSAALDTAMNPRATTAFALAIIADGEAPAYPGMPDARVQTEAASKDAQAIDAATAELARLAPQGGSYLSESNYFNPHWQQAYFGEHYAKLQAVKARYDPDGLFFVHHGVGCEEWSADGFTRVS